jgi:hypothetical protein
MRRGGAPSDGVVLSRKCRNSEPMSKPWQKDDLKKICRLGHNPPAKIILDDRGTHARIVCRTLGISSASQITGNVTFWRAYCHEPVHSNHDYPP